MSKYGGLSQLADAARDLTQPAEACYPVRRKGERRRLNPNQAGIDWLEGRCTDGKDFLSDTEITHTHSAGERVDPGGFEEPEYEYNILRAGGAALAARRGQYVRPMFQTLGITGDSEQQTVYRDPCPDCDDWSRTGRCAQHHDRDGIEGLMLGVARGRELRRVWNGRTHAETMNASLERSFSQFGNVTIEVNGETVQGVRVLSYQVEGEHGRQTVSWRS